MNSYAVNKRPLYDKFKEVVIEIKNYFPFVERITGSEQTDSRIKRVREIAVDAAFRYSFVGLFCRSVLQLPDISRIFSEICVTSFVMMFVMPGAREGAQDFVELYQKTKKAMGFRSWYAPPVETYQILPENISDQAVIKKYEQYYSRYHLARDAARGLALVLTFIVLSYKVINLPENLRNAEDYNERILMLESLLYGSGLVEIFSRNFLLGVVELFHYFKKPKQHEDTKTE